jgi:hypothetical protein
MANDICVLILQQRFDVHFWLFEMHVRFLALLMVKSK